MTYYIEYLAGTGFWTPLRESTQRTGFVWAPVQYASEDEANEVMREMLTVGWRNLRVTNATGVGALPRSQ